MEQLLASIASSKQWSHFARQYLANHIQNQTLLAVVADNWYPISFSGNLLQMQSDSAGDFYNNAENIAILSRALGECLGEKIGINLELEAETGSKFAVEQAENKVRQAELEQEFKSIPVVENILQELGGSILKVEKIDLN